MARQITTVTIESGTAISEAVELAEYNLVGILIPEAWTDASITILGAVNTGVQPGGPGTPKVKDQLDYYPVYDIDGEVKFTGIPTTGGGLIVVPNGTLTGVQFVKIRSGAVAADVNQGADRTIRLVLGE